VREGARTNSCEGHLHADGRRHPHNLLSLEKAQDYNKESWGDVL